MPIKDIQDKLNTFVENADNTQLLDKSTFYRLMDETSAEVTWDILTAFKTTLAECIHQLERSTNSTEEQQKICHKLKGSSLLIGFVSLGELCKTTISDIKNEKFEHLGKHIENVLACAYKTQHYMNSIIK